MHLVDIAIEITYYCIELCQCKSHQGDSMGGLLAWQAAPVVVLVLA
jgi:hypothetical protein